LAKNGQMVQTPNPLGANLDLLRKVLNWARET